MTVKVLRQINSDVSAKLRSGDPFLYAHLVKFEKPIKTVTGAVAEAFQDYSYLTDASHNVDFDDGSQNSVGDWNGSRTYVAERLIKVGSVGETTQAKATSMSLTLDAVALNSTVAPASTTIVHDSNPATVEISESWIEAGFSEGDKIRIASDDGNNGKYIIITGFRNANKTVTVILESGGVSASSNANYTFTIETEEHSSLFAGKDESSYAHYINREVYVYKALLDPTTGEIIGRSAPPIINSTQQGYDDTYIAGPILIFKGIIANVKLKEDPNKVSEITWGLTSHWGDFVTVNGRVTSDTEHRGINGQGETDYAALVRPEYINDFGFAHSEQALNLISQYKATETKYRFKKSGFLGFGSGRTIEYEVEVEREIELKFNLDARRLPVVYGVNRIDSFPIFVDLDKNKTNNVYTAYALCEGEIGGLYDIYIDDKSRICADANDSGTRSSDSDAVSVVCEGRKDRGDTLASKSLHTTSTSYIHAGPYGSININGVDYKGGPREMMVFAPELGWTPISDVQNNTKSPATGIRHKLGHVFETPINTKLIFHRGKPDQEADQTLVHKAAAGEFLVQDQYFDSDDKSNYWGPNHRLLDTAYVVCHFEITEEDLQIPELDFVVRGRILPCHNYDWSYREDPFPPTADPAHNNPTDFQLGESVTLHKTSGDAQIGSAITIADFHTYYDEDSDGSTTGDPPVSTDTGKHQIWRFASDPGLGTTTSFYMKGSTGKRWYFNTHEHKSITAASIVKNLTATVASYSGGTANGTKIVLNAGTGDQGEFVAKALEYADGLAPVFASSASDEARAKINYSFFVTSNSDGSKVNSSTLTIDNISNILPANGWNTTDIPSVRVPKAIVIPGGNTTENYYFGMIVKVTRTKEDGTRVIQKRLIVKSKNITYGSSSSAVVAIVSHDWDIDASGDFTLAPTSAAGLGGGTRVADKIDILTKPDNRITINPAMQLLDYITNKRYGKGLDLEKDIDLDSFKTVARLCDTRSDVSIIFPSNASISVGDVYRYDDDGDNTGNTVWQGTVSTISSNIGYSGGTYKEVTFTSCIGKLGHKWFDWKGYNPGDLLWEPFTGRFWINTETTFKTVTVPSSNGAFGQSITLYRVGSGSGASSLNPYVGSFASQGANASTGSVSFEGNPFIKSWSGTGFTVNGYSLYDADDVKYWRYLGWQSQNQREVTRHQACPVIDTNTTVFANINTLLAHFNGILRYSNGKYELDIQSSAVLEGFGANDTRIIRENDIVGAITVEDDGQKNSKNTVSVNFPDPQQDYGNRAVTYFNSNYLAEDRNIPKKQDIKTPHILNYFNARINAKQYLDQSRYGKKINFIMEPKGNLLLAGTIIQVSYPRFGWGSDDIPVVEFSTQGKTTTSTPHGFKVGDVVRYEDISIPQGHGSVGATAFNNSYFTVSEVVNSTSFKTNQADVATVAPASNITLGKVYKKGEYYRISNLNMREDCAVQVTAIEHNDESFLIKKRKSDIVGIEGPANPVLQAPGAPTNLAVSVDADNEKFILSWTNHSDCFKKDGTTWNTNFNTEIWNNYVGSFSGTSSIAPVSNITPWTGGATQIDEEGKRGWLDGIKNSSKSGGITKFEYTPMGSGDQPRYHWIRHVKEVNVQGPNGTSVRTVASPWHPVSGNGISGTVTKRREVGEVSIVSTNGVVVFYNNTVRTNPSGNLTFRVTPSNLASNKVWQYQYWISINKDGNAATKDYILSNNATASASNTSNQYKGVNHWDSSSSSNSQAYDDFTLHLDYEPKSPADNSTIGNLNGASVTLYVNVFELDNTNGVPANAEEIAKDKISLSAIDIGKPGYELDFNNATHTFYANNDGTADATDFGGCTPTIYRVTTEGSQALTYAPFTSNVADNTFSYGDTNNETTDQDPSGSAIQTDGITGTNCSPVLDTSNGKITLQADTNGIISGTTTPFYASVLLRILDNKQLKANRTGDDARIKFQTLNFTKIPDPIRAGATHIIDVGDTNTPVDLGTTEYDHWAATDNSGPRTTPNVATAKKIAAHIAAASPDGFIRPNDIVTVLKSGSESATRIYTGNAVAYAAGTTDNGMSSITPTNWSTLVTQEFSGSVIVSETLSADALIANTTVTRGLEVQSSIKIGTTDGSGNQVSGQIHTPNKSAPGSFVASPDTDDGIFIGHVQKSGSSGNSGYYPVIDIGDGTNYFRYNAVDGFQLGGSMAVAAAGQTGESTAIIYMRATSTPTEPPDDQITVAAAVAAANTANNNQPSSWSVTVPAGSNQLYASFGRRAAHTSAQGSTTYWVWETAVQYDAVDGAAGQKSYVQYVYQRTTSGNNIDGQVPTNSNQTYADPVNGVASGSNWVTTNPGLQADGDKIWISQRRYTSDAAAPQDSGWSTAVIYSWRVDGQDSTAQGAAGTPGPGMFRISTGTDSTINEQSITTGLLASATGRGYAILGDHAIVVNSVNVTKAYRCILTTTSVNHYNTQNASGNVWQEATAFFGGDVIIDGGVSAQKLTIVSSEPAQNAGTQPRAAGIFMTGDKGTAKIEVKEWDSVNSTYKDRVKIGYLGS